MREELTQVLDFLRAEASVLSSAPHLLFQQAANQPDGSIVSQLAADRITNKRDSVRPWLKWINKPQQVTGRFATLPADSAVSSCAFSPDGKRILGGSADGRLRIWDSQTGAELANLPAHANPIITCSVTDCCFSPDGTEILSASWDRSLCIWDSSTFDKLARLFGHQHYVNTCHYSPDGKYLASGSWDNSLKIWDAKTHREVASINHRSGQVKTCAWSPDGRWLAYGTGSKFRIRDLTTEKEIMLAQESEVDSCAWSPDGSRIVSVAGHCVTILNPVSGEVTGLLSDPAAHFLSCAYSFDAGRIAVGTADNLIRVLDSTTAQELFRLIGHSGYVEDCSFSPDNSQIASASADGTVRLWNASSPEPISSSEPKHHHADVTCCVFSEGKRLMAAAYFDGSVEVWQADQAKLVMTIRAHPWPVERCRFSPDGNQLLSYSSHELKIWDINSGDTTASLKWHFNMVYAAEYSPDGKRVVSGSRDGWVKLWDSKTGTEIATIKASDSVNCCAYSPDGTQFVASAGRDLQVFDIRSLALRATLEGHYAPVNTCAWSPTANRIVSGSGDRTLKIWDSLSGKAIRTLQARDSVVHCQFSPDGKKIISASAGTSSADPVLRIWDAESGDLITSLVGHTGQITGCRFVSDGDMVVSCSWDGTLRTWDSFSGKQLQQFNAGGRIKSVATSCAGDLIVAGDQGGTLYFLQRSDAHTL